MANGVEFRRPGTGAWSSTNPLVASVDGSGNVTAIGAGTADITYTITGGCGGTVSAFQTISVTPNAAITSVTGGSSPLCINGTTTVMANGVELGGAGTGAWSSTNPLVASVDGSGNVTAIGAGTADITYTITGGCGGTVSAFQTISVNPNAAITSVTGGSSPLCINGTTTVMANGVELGGAGTGAWSSTNPLVASVDGSGNVTAIGAGTADITYTITGGCGGTVSAFQTISVTPNAAITSVTGGSSPLCINGTTTVMANGVELGGAGTGAWSSTNPLVASVDGSGNVTAIGAGTADITYTITGGCGGTVSAFQTISVTPNAAITSVTGGSSPLCINGTTTVMANGVELGGAGTGAWSSTNPLVASVDGSGNVTAIGAGTADITYTITGGCGGTVSAFQTISVTPNAAITSVTGGSSPLCINGTTTVMANGVELGGAGTGAWSSTNPLVASVDGSGNVTAIGAGTADITYTITGGCGGTVSAFQTISVNPNAAITSVTGGTSPLCINGTTMVTANGVVLGGGSGDWSSTNMSVATVDGSGNVTAVGAGTTDITFTITNGCGGTVSAFQTITVYPNAAVTSVTGTSPLCIGSTATYAARCNIRWRHRFMEQQQCCSGNC